jgi:hypothetical protein
MMLAMAVTGRKSLQIKLQVARLTASHFEY